MKIYNAENQILGRFSSIVAKELLKGETIVVVNAEKAVVAGRPRYTLEKYAHKYERGDPLHGPFFPKQPDRILRRTVRGMLPWDRTKGRNAYRRLHVHIGVPDELKGNESSFMKVEAADADKLNTKFVTVGEIAMHIGAKKRW
ncbi:MAG TPA: 50S ribosomal protein L13 [archaeon]|nr:50S ribosomal protein L13 [archaeon]